MTRSLPILPLRDIVVFPHRIVPLFVGREKSVAALEAAMATDKELFLVAQLDPGEDDPDRDALYDLGVIATAMQLLKLPDGTVRVLVEGVKRARLVNLETRDGYVAANMEPTNPVWLFTRIAARVEFASSSTTATSSMIVSRGHTSRGDERLDQREKQAWLCALAREPDSGLQVSNGSDHRSGCERGQPGSLAHVDSALVAVKLRAYCVLARLDLEAAVGEQRK